MSAREQGGARARRQIAAAWRARQAMGEAGVEAGLARWLAESAANRTAWAEAESAWRVFEGARNDPGVDAAVSAALTRARAAAGRLRAMARMAAAAAVVLVAWGGLSLVPRDDSYRTALNERRTITLADGSRITLDADSLLKVDLEHDARNLELVRGQASFDVAHDPTRPFAVRAGDHRVLALGTRFNVDLLGETVRVTLLEGRVSVSRAEPRLGLGRDRQPASAVDLRRGEQAVLGAAAVAAQVVQADIPKATAWQDGQLVFDEEPLAAVVERMNRYSRVKLEVKDPALAARRISGVFRAGDVATFLDAAQHHLALRVVSTGQDRVELRPAAG